MSLPNFVDLSSDNEIEGKEEVRPDFTSNLIQQRPSFTNSNCHPEFEDHAVGQGFREDENPYGYPINSHIMDMGDLYANGFCYQSPLPGSMPISRQFWKAGDYEAAPPPGPVSQNGQNRLRVHPKFLHSNATSHKWAFGALAELLDNAVDEVKSGASFVVIDKFTNSRDGNPALLIKDDGGGMDPDSLRCCMSFGFSNKRSDSSIGQYGNGFKTSTMRLGADVIAFSRCMSIRNITQSVGLLSYTFLKQTGYDDIIVPMVDYISDPLTGLWKRIIRCGEKQFYSNLSTILRWSPFATEDELLKQFDDIGDHGTKVIVFNLWFNDGGDMELDFDTNEQDIMLTGATKIVKRKNTAKMLNQSHIATKLCYSLRAYSSILYLHLPVNFSIILRGQVVEPHRIASDLRFIEIVKYKPQVGGDRDKEPVIHTGIGFLEGAPSIGIHGFNVYHKNRLILPFWPVVSSTSGKCRGVAGVLEVNFMKPTHNKQDFERSILYERLETRLKDMAVEYWDKHCHLIGMKLAKRTVPSPAQPFVPHQMLQPGADFSTGVSDAQVGNAHLSAGKPVVSALNSPTYSSPGQFFSSSDYSHLEPPRKRIHVELMESLKKNATTGEIGGGHGSNQLNRKGKGDQVQKLITMVRERKKLQTKCSEFETAEKQLLIKIQKLTEELQEVQQENDRIESELKSMDKIKMERELKSMDKDKDGAQINGYDKNGANKHGDALNILQLPTHFCSV